MEPSPQTWRLCPPATGRLTHTPTTPPTLYSTSPATSHHKGFATQPRPGPIRTRTKNPNLSVAERREGPSCCEISYRRGPLDLFGALRIDTEGLQYPISLTFGPGMAGNTRTATGSCSVTPSVPGHFPHSPKPRIRLSCIQDQGLVQVELAVMVRRCEMVLIEEAGLPLIIG